MERQIAKELYWKYALITTIIFVAIVLFIEFQPFLSGFLGACTVYVLVRRQMLYFTDKRKMRKTLAAMLIMIEVLLCFLIPAFLVIWVAVSQIEIAKLDTTALIDTIQSLANLVETKVGYNLLSPDNIATLASFLTNLGQKIVEQVSGFVVNAIVLIFVLYFMLIGQKSMEAYVYDLLPFSDKNKKYMLSNVKVMVTSNAIGIPLLAIIQGVIATVGYLIFDAPNPFLFGFLTCFATIIPFVGTSLVWFPLALYLVMNGSTFNGIGLAIYALAVISNIDNFVRFALQKKMADIHPLITVFGVIIGLSLFGFWGVIFGPLLLSVFLLCVNIFKEEYLGAAPK